MERRVPTKAQVMAYLKEDSNWGRWGPDDQMDAMNFITPEKRVAAARLVQSGRAVSLSREFPKGRALSSHNISALLANRKALAVSLVGRCKRR